MSERGDDRSFPILPPSDLDTSSNFIHMSTASQVSGTLERFFPINPDEHNVVYLLRVELGPLEQRDDVVKWESPDATVCGPRPGEGLFPHLYFDGGNKGDNVERSMLEKSQAEETKQDVSVRALESREVKLAEQRRRLWLTKDEVESAREVVVEAGSEGGWNNALKALQEWLI